MTADQMLQYQREVQAAQSSARGAQIADSMQGSRAIRNLNDARSPEGILRRNFETTLSANFGRGGAGAKAASEGLEGLYKSANKQSEAEGSTAMAQQQYADQQARQRLLDQYGMAKDQYGRAIDERTYQDGAAQRANAQQLAQLSSIAISPSATPEQRDNALKLLNLAQGNGGMQIKAIDLPDQIAPDGITRVKGGQALVAIHPDGRVQQINPQQGQQTQQSELARPANKAEFDAIPKGAKFIDPNGQVRIK
jgi:hypothetical protein